MGEILKLPSAIDENNLNAKEPLSRSLLAWFLNIAANLGLSYPKPGA